MQVRLVIDTMIMKQMALSGNSDPSSDVARTYAKIFSEKHVVIVSKQLIQQYQTIMEQEEIPAEFFLNIVQNIWEANGLLKRVSDAQAAKMQLHIRFPSEDAFLAKIAIVADPNKFNVYIISNEGEIYKEDAKLYREHKIRCMDCHTYSTEYC